MRFLLGRPEATSFVVSFACCLFVLATLEAAFTLEVYRQYTFIIRWSVSEIYRSLEQTPPNCYASPCRRETRDLYLLDRSCRNRCLQAHHAVLRYSLARYSSSRTNTAKLPGFSGSNIWQATCARLSVTDSAAHLLSMPRLRCSVRGIGFLLQ